MEQKLNEKKAILEVIESILDNMEWTVKSKGETIEQYQIARKAEQEAARDEDREPDYSSIEWERRNADRADDFLNAYETVKKHLEKLI